MAGNYHVGLSTVTLSPAFTTDSFKGPTPQIGPYPGDGLDLTVRAVYIANENWTEPVIMVSADLVNISPVDTDYVRDAANYPTIPNLTRERILISITHAHTTPGSSDTSVRTYAATVNTDAQPGSTWRLWMRDQIKTAIIAAYNDAYEYQDLSTLTFYRSKWNEGWNRRTQSQTDLTNAAGTSLNDAAGHDRTLDVVKIVRDGSVLGVLFFYGLHPAYLVESFPYPADLGQCDVSPHCGLTPSGLYYHHPDYPGFARKAIETAYPGSTAIFFQSAGGDVDYPTGCYMYCSSSRIGASLGARVLNVLSVSPAPANAVSETIVPQQNRGNTAYNRMWAAPLQTAAGDQRIAGPYGEPRGLDTEATGYGVASSYWYYWASHYCSGTTGHGGDNAPCSPKVALDRSWDMEFQTLTVGQWRVAGLSHEPVSLYALKARQQWLSDRVSFVGYIQREQNYLPTSSQIEFDETCLVASPPAGCVISGQLKAYEGYRAQMWNGNPSPWATYDTTTPSTTGYKYDTEAEIDRVMQMETLKRVNYAHRVEGATATSNGSTLSDRTPEAAINGDRIGRPWASDPLHGSGWHDASYDTYDDILEIDFHQPRTIDEINVITVQDGIDNPLVTLSAPDLTTVFTQYGIVNFTVEYFDATQWPSGVWAQVKNGRVTSNNKVMRQFLFAPVTTTKIRVVVDLGTAHYSRIIEVEAWGNATSRRNVALASAGATAAGSSTPLTNRPASAAINGDVTGKDWATDPVNGSGWHESTLNTYPDTFEVTFARTETINEIDIYGVQNDPNAPVDPTETTSSANYGLIAFKIETSTDGVTYDEIEDGTVTNNALAWRKFRFKPVAANRVLITINDAEAGYSRIVEVQAFTPYDFLSSLPTTTIP